MQDFMKSLEQSSLSFCSMDPTLSDADIINEILSNTRQLMDMEVAFISEFTDTQRVFRFLDADRTFCPINVNEGGPLEESYCQKVVNGTMPELIRDTQRCDAALALAATKAFPVGAHVSVPIIFSDGTVFGTFCCFSRFPNQQLNEYDLNTLRFIAKCSSRILERSAKLQQEKVRLHDQIAKIIASPDSIQSLFQPIVDIQQGKAIGYEALSRFNATPKQPPDFWFKQAFKAGLAVELELKAARQAIDIFFKDGPDDGYLSVNFSPKSIKAAPDAFIQLVTPHLKRLVIELTEHNEVKNYSLLNSIFKPLRERGLRIGVDDAGAGYSSFRHILLLRPDMIKLDRSLVSRICVETDKYLLTEALVSFAGKSGESIIAEGVESQEELEALSYLGVTKIQGFYLGKPQPVGYKFDFTRLL